MLFVAGFGIPSEMIAHRRKRRRNTILQLDSEAFAQFTLHMRDTEAANGVFPARGAAIFALPVLALQRDDRAHGIDHLRALDTSEMKREERLGGWLIVRHAHAAAAEKLVAAAVANHRHQADIVGEQINAVVVRMRE